MKVSFKYKIMLSFLLIEIFFLSIIIIYNYNSVKKFSSNMVDTQINSNIVLFTELVKTPIMTYDLATLDNMTENFGNLPNMWKVVLTDKDNRVLSEFQSNYYHNDIKQDNKSIKESRFVISNDSGIIGYCNVIFDIDNIVKNIDEQTGTVIQIALLEILLSLFVAYYLGRALTKNLRILDDACENVSSEKEKLVPVDIHSGDEFEHLAFSFNKMQSNIQEEVHKNKESQLQLLNQSKMVALGEMIENIAHQWRQPLSVISTAATGMRMQKEYNCLPDEVFNNTCLTINENAQYLSQTIEDFKSFIKGDSKQEIFSIEDNMKSFLSLIQGSIKSNNINVSMDLDKDIEIDGYKNELIQCYLNIYNNSKDAFRDNKITNKYFFINVSKENEKFVIKLKDNAGGMPDDILQKIFEPYFTTKHKSQGTGLGLHMTYNLITQGMKGTIKANVVNYVYEGKSQKGTEFIIVL